MRKLLASKLITRQRMHSKMISKRNMIKEPTIGQPNKRDQNQPLRRNGSNNKVN